MTTLATIIGQTQTTQLQNIWSHTEEVIVVMSMENVYMSKLGNKSLNAAIRC